MPLSAIINTKNASQTLAQALESLSFADEIIVVDMHSSDQTLAIAKKYTSKIFTYQDVGYVEPAREFAVSKASYNWVLIVDADEEIPASLAKEIRQLISKSLINDKQLNNDSSTKTNQVDSSSLNNSDQFKTDSDKKPPVAYYLARKNIIWGHTLKKTGWWPDYQLRLFVKDKIKFSSTIHQPPQVLGKAVYLPASEELAIVHHNYQTVGDYLERFNRYTTHEKDQHLQKAISSELLIGSFFEELFKRYFHQTGYEDGLVGTGLSFAQANYQLFALLKAWEENCQSGLSNRHHSLKDQKQIDPKKQSKLDSSIQYQSQKNYQNQLKIWKKVQKQLNYYLADWQIKNSSGLSQLYWRVVRKLNS